MHLWNDKTRNSRGKHSSLLSYLEKFSDEHATVQLIDVFQKASGIL